jgi:hypothetical protein
LVSIVYGGATRRRGGARRVEELERARCQPEARDARDVVDEFLAGGAGLEDDVVFGALGVDAVEEVVAGEGAGVEGDAVGEGDRDVGGAAQEKASETWERASSTVTASQARDGRRTVAGSRTT